MTESSKHRLQSICPYFAMFPEDFARRHILAYSNVGDHIFDPFCGRGTSVLEGLLLGRNAAGSDVSELAVCVTGAKADPPTASEVHSRLSELEQAAEHFQELSAADEFFRLCFHEHTYRQLCQLRRELDWRNNRVDRFIAAVALGCLHGESHKSPNCFSNRMPRTISTKPAYSIRWWAARDLWPPHRDVFGILKYMCGFRLSSGTPEIRGMAKRVDARTASSSFEGLSGQVSLIITSPPYFDTTDFREDQWLRLWFLGGPERPQSLEGSDDRHTSLPRYWNFLTESWAGCANLLRESATIVIRIGGTKVAKDQIAAQLLESLQGGLKNFHLKLEGEVVSSEIRNRQTNAFRPGTNSKRFEHDFVIAAQRH